MKPYFSNWGAYIDVNAPGTDILSLRARNQDIYDKLDQKFVNRYILSDYIRASGTSQSAAYISGVAALVLTKYSDYSVDLVKSTIANTAYKAIVAGRVDVEEAVK